MKKLMIALIATAAVAGTAQAQTAGRAYVGTAVVSAKNTTVDAHKADGKLFAGYQFDERLGVEAGWTNHHKTDFGVRGSTEGYGTYVAAKYTLPINEQVSAYGKVGLSHNERKLSNDLGQRFKDDDTGGYGGVGVEYKLNQNVALQAEYERYGKSKAYGAKPDVVSVGLKYGF
jgi:outer membrane autotransporter protein